MGGVKGFTMASVATSLPTSPLCGLTDSRDVTIFSDAALHFLLQRAKGQT